MFDRIASSEGWYDPSKLAEVLKTLGNQADGRLNTLTGDKLLSILNPIAAPQFVQGQGAYSREVPGDSSFRDEGYEGDYFVSSNGTILGAGDGLAGGSMEGRTFTDTYDNPVGNGKKDQAVVTYKIINGQAVPISALGSYRPSNWIDGGRDAAMIGGTVLGAGALGAALAGGAAAGGAGGGAVGGVAGGSVGAGSAAASGLDVAGLTALDSAAYAGAGDSFLAGAGGFGAAGGTGGAVSSSPGLWNSLLAGDWGGAGTAVGNWATSGDGLRTLAGVGSTLLQNNAAGNALDAQRDATSQSNALLKYMYDQTRADNAPALAARNNALASLTGLVNNPGSITSDPGYQFQLSQGTQAIDRSAASRGGLYSGATLKALDRYGTDYGATKLNDTYNRLSTIAGLGSSAASLNANAGSTYGANVSNNLTGLGNATAGTALNSGNLWSNLLNSTASTYGGGSNDLSALLKLLKGG